jgi:hypothetical protein
MTQFSDTQLGFTILVCCFEDFFQNLHQGFFLIFSLFGFQINASDHYLIDVKGLKNATTFNFVFSTSDSISSALKSAKFRWACFSIDHSEIQTELLPFLKST